MEHPHRSGFRSPAETRWQQSGPSSSTSALVAGLITVALGSGGIYYWVHSSGGGDPSVPPTASSMPMGMEDPAASSPAATEDPLPSPPEVPEEVPDSDIAARPAPAETVKALVQALMAHDEGEMRALLGNQLASDEEKMLLEALESGAATIDPNRPVTHFGQVGLVDRWAINLLNQTTRRIHPLTLDFAKGEDGAWAVEAVRLLESFAQDAKGPSEVVAQVDAFLKKLGSKEYGALREFVQEGQVPNEKLAALGIIFTEGGFQPLERGGLRVTNVSEERAWVIASVRSADYELESEFGFELAREGDAWMIQRINLSRLMREFSQIADGDDAFNPPLVHTPAGGDSLVLYFGYDDDKLTAHALKQLAVVAAILAQTEHKKIKIGGHADALGEEDYNDALSRRRARRVAETLRSLGVRGSQVGLEAFGERLPLSPNVKPDGTDNPAGRKRNRRAEIYLDF